VAHNYRDRAKTAPQTKGKRMAGKFDLDAYETVELRLRRLYGKFPEARVMTDLVFHDERRFIVKAEIYLDRDDMTPVATGYAEEIVGASPVNRTSALENGETSAIGRGLANCGFASEGKRPSRTEMEKVERYKAEPRMPATKEKQWTPADEKQASLAIEAANLSKDIDKLKEIWDANKAVADLEIDGITLLTKVNQKKAEFDGE
jgi:hypothetical protein